MAETERCIYCGKPVDTSRGEGDHIIPAGLGEFRNDIRFRRICTACNNDIGKSEAQLLRCGTARLYREIVLSSRTGPRKRKGRWSVGAEGMPPPKIVVHHSGTQLLAEHRSDGNAVELVDQLIVEEEGGDTHHIQLFPDMSPESLRRRYESLDVGGKPVIRFNCDEHRYHKYEKLIHDALNMYFASHTSIPEGLSQATVRFEFRVNDHYFRAIAKIALHYYLAHSVRHTGYEELFDPIKRFIRAGGNIDSFFNAPRIFAPTEEVLFRSVASARWVHCLGTCEHNRAIIGYVRLFYGPRSRGAEYHLRVGDLASDIIVPTAAWAHCWAYDNPVGKGGTVGEVRRVTLRRFR